MARKPNARTQTLHTNKPVAGYTLDLVTGGYNNAQNIGVVPHPTPWKQPAGNFSIPTEQANSFMGPQQPILPVAPADVAGRRYDFSPGANLSVNARSDESITFDQLQAMSDNCELVRLAIETRKDQMSRLEWNIVPRDPDTDPEKFQKQIDDIEKALRYPDQQHDWGTWLRQLIDQVLVHDAPCLYPRIARNGTLLSLDVMDGTLIKLVIDEWGRTPAAPSPAYVQNLHGVPAVDYTVDELIYRPRNPRAHKLYGFSPVEQVIRTCNIAIRRQLFQLDYFTEGNDPQSLVTMPETWTTKQIEEFQEYWDQLLTGNLAQRRKMRFITHDAKYYPMKEAALTDAFDEWLARIICYAFSLPPTAFTKAVNRATAEQANEAAIEEGLSPLMLWVKQTMDFIIFKYFGSDDLVFKWSEDTPESPLEEAQIADLYLRNGTKSIDEIRIDLGLDPVGFGNAIYLTTGAELLEDILNPPDPPPMLPPPGSAPGTMPKQTPSGAPQPPPQAAPGSIAPKDKPTDKAPDKSSKSDFATFTKQVDPPLIDRDRYDVSRDRKALETLAKSVLEKVAKDVAKQLPELLKKQTIRTTKHDTVIAISKADKQKDDPQQVVDKLDLDGFDVLKATSASILAGVFISGQRAGLQQLGLDTTTLDNLAPAAREASVAFAQQTAAEMVTSVDATTREMLKGLVVQAMDEGWTVEALAERIKQSTAFDDYRATMIARTEIARADMAGNLIAYSASGVVLKKQWFKTLASESDVCDTNAAAGAIPLTQSFPSGDPAPPSHPNCACVIVPVT